MFKLFGFLCLCFSMSSFANCYDDAAPLEIQRKCEQFKIVKVVNCYDENISKEDKAKCSEGISNEELADDRLMDMIKKIQQGNVSETERDISAEEIFHYIKNGVPQKRRQMDKEVEGNQ